jgi:alanyl-tRNA synthetase
MTGVNEIRATFLDYFKKNGHEAVASSPLVPRNDPTLMFTNSGMVQFKNVFTGVEARPYSRATTSQKCVRAGGKHNDLDNVGYSERHLTFFEMLGNFSFGDYFKADAIAFAWELVTREFGLPKDNLLVTVYSEDEEAAALWKKVAGFSDSRIIRIASDDNFWRMGDTGPCGPCTEIFFDQGDKVKGGPPGSADQDGDRFLEFWNLVFMQYEQRGPPAEGGPSAQGERVGLPRPSIDTGMGLERMAGILQGVKSIYDTDLFRALIAASIDAVGRKPQSDLGPRQMATQMASHKVIADHLRSTSFLIADGVLPSNEGRGYVLRRIMRRAMRHAQLLGAKEPVMWRLVPALVREMGQAYPELVRAQALITETLKIEETRFGKTLERGIGLLDEATKGLGAGKQLAGDVAFKLYDTYGFPLDLTQDALKARNIGVDTKGFNAAMERQRADARKAWSGSGDAATEAVWFQIKEQTGATEFLGYDTETAEGVILALVKDGKPVAALKAGESGALIMNQTPFYGESGGQVGDHGLIRTGTGAGSGAGSGAASFRVTETQKKLGDLVVHVGTMDQGTFKTGDAAELLVEHNRRTATRANHSATHLLHEALRLVLGTHVAQKGSMVSPDRLRFDFSHTKPVSAEDIAHVENLANAIILQNAAVETRLMPVEDAMQSGAMALFGEKYGDEVRVVSMGDGAPGSNKAWSVELCGGTHVRRTGDIGLVKVVAESASAAGVRRIEAVTAEGARAYLAEQDARMRQAAALLRVKPEDVVGRIEALLDERKTLERQLADAKRQLALGGAALGVGTGGGAAAAAEASVRSVGKVKLMARTLPGIAAKDLRGLVDDGKAQIGSGVVALVGVSEDGRAALSVGVTEDLVTTLSAVDLVKVGAEALGGKGGGGRPDMAQAGGPDGTKAEAALAAIEAAIKQKLGA